MIKGRSALVVFDTVYGNTETIARALCDGIREQGVEADCVNVHSVKFYKLTGYDLIAVGAPTHHTTASQSMKDFLKQLGTNDFIGQYGFAFDTRISYFFAGSAAKYIEKRLEEMGLEILMQRSSALVKSVKGDNTKAGETMLEEGEEERFRKIGAQIGAAIRG